jgi:hypothetical protein
MWLPVSGQRVAAWHVCLFPFSFKLRTQPRIQFQIHPDLKTPLVKKIFSY